MGDFIPYVDKTTKKAMMNRLKNTKISIFDYIVRKRDK